MVDKKKKIDSDDKVITKPIDTDSIEPIEKKAKRKRLFKRSPFIVAISIITGLIFISLYYYSTNQIDNKKTQSSERIELYNMVKLLQDDLKIQKLENDKLNKKLLNLSRKFKTTDNTITQNKLTNEGLFESLSDQISKMVPLTVEPNTVPSIDEISIIKKTNELKELEKRLKLLSADIKKRMEISEEQNKNIKITQEITSLKESIMALKKQIQSGKPFDEQIYKLADRVELSEEFKRISTIGIIPIVELKSMFPQFARDTLSAIHKNTDETNAKKKFFIFLQEKLGVRSLTPRQGNDPDAILSRVEASIKADNFNDALSLLSTIPESGMIIMAEWIKNLEEWVLVNNTMNEFDSLMEKEEIN